ncbi:hypothetical protein J4440_01570 [Candidatus Woesearchaeota archaeon]|nr:hypothetical protein [Candidatus Woesearchaeota archaeon]
MNELEISDFTKIENYLKINDRASVRRVFEFLRGEGLITYLIGSILQKRQDYRDIDIMCQYEENPDKLLGILRNNPRLLNTENLKFNILETGPGTYLIWEYRFTIYSKNDSSKIDLGILPKKGWEAWQKMCKDIIKEM